MARRIVEINKLLEWNGFELVRQNKHKVFKNKLGMTYTMSATPSDWRVDMQRITALRRLYRENGHALITDEPCKIKIKEEGMSQFQNTPQVSGPSSQWLAEATQKHTDSNKPRHLDEEAFRIIQEGHAKGWTYHRCANALTKLNYVTVTGIALSPSHISNFMNSRGVRRKVKHSRGTPIKEAATVTEAVPKVRTSRFLSDLMDILSSTLNDGLKEKLIVGMVQERNS